MASKVPQSWKGPAGAGGSPSVHYCRQIAEACGTSLMTAGQVHTDCLPFTASPSSTAQAVLTTQTLWETQRRSASLPCSFSFSSSWTDSQWSNARLSGEAGWLRSDKGPIPAGLPFRGQAATASTWEWAVMDVQPWRSSSALSPGAHAEREVAGGILAHCEWWWWGCEGCAFPHLPWGSWEPQLSASGRPGGSLLEASVASREEDPGTPRKAVVSFWETGDVWHLALFLSTESHNVGCQLFPFYGLWGETDELPCLILFPPDIYTPPSSQRVQIETWPWSCHHPAAQRMNCHFLSMPFVGSLLWHLNSTWPQSTFPDYFLPGFYYPTSLTWSPNIFHSHHWFLSSQIGFYRPSKAFVYPRFCSCHSWFLKCCSLLSFMPNFNSSFKALLQWHLL